MPRTLKSGYAGRHRSGQGGSVFDKVRCRSLARGCGFLRKGQHDAEDDDDGYRTDIDEKLHHGNKRAEQKVIDPCQSGEAHSQAGDRTHQALSMHRYQGTGDHQGDGYQEDDTDYALGGKKCRRRVLAGKLLFASVLILQPFHQSR
jgi:hypothetical protein